MTERSQSERRVRRNAVLLALLALAFYAVYFAVQAKHLAG